MTPAISFFIERVTRTVLPKKLLECNESIDVIMSVMESSEVATHWSAIAQPITEEADRSVLLQDIVALWVTMRGFSMASAWMEQFKRAREAHVRKKRGLRKNLQKMYKSLDK